MTLLENFLLTIYRYSIFRSAKVNYWKINYLLKKEKAL